MKYTLLSLFFFILSSPLKANKTDDSSVRITKSLYLALPISGKIIDAKGNPLVGVRITTKGRSVGTVTDVNGNFQLEAAIGETLYISHIGFKTMEVAATATPLTITLEEDAATLGEVSVLGSRGKPRTDVNRPVPVDVLSAKDLQNTNQIELGQQLQFSSPSYNSAKYGINGSLVYADYATLRGLGPDQILVLVNGKRRHQFSAAQIGFTISRGMVVTDMNTIPFLATEQAEILRDGAASQYGSDAIAGIVNIKLRQTVNQGTFRTQVGTTQKGDGTNYMAALNYGFKLGKEKSFLNFTLHYQVLGETNRSDNYRGRIYSATKQIDDSIRAVRKFYPATDSFKVGIFGASDVKSPQVFINTGYPINDTWSLYGFGGYSFKKAKGYGFFRNAIPTDANSNPGIYPDGYVPVFPAEDQDYSAVVGLTRTVLNGWNMDFSTGYGKNAVDRFASNTTNTSLGTASPTEFFVGSSAFGQSTTEANLSRNYPNLWKMKALNLAFGGQFRVDKYQLLRGDENSYKIGPLATSQGKTPGPNGIGAVSPLDEANESRSNTGIYADIEADITEKFLVAGALRFENYSDFGSNLSGKIASRLNLTKNIALRASINKGFRAPSLQQTFLSSTATLVQAGQIRFSKQFRSNDPLLDTFGIQDPKPEIAWSYNLGLTAKIGEQFLFTVDAYRIDITDKIVISEALAVNNIAVLKAKLASSGYQQISFFTNHIGTKTRGIDLVSSYKTAIGDKSTLNISLGATWNETKVQEIKKTPDEIQVGTVAKIAIIDTISIALIETAQPRQKVIFSTTYSIGRLSLVGRATYFGKVAAWEKPSGLPHIRQEFGAKTLIDVSLAYGITEKLKLTIGSNNITNQYPDKVLPTLAAYASGQTPFNRNVNQFGFAGAFYYGNLTFNF